MKQITDDIINTSGVTVTADTPAADDLFDVTETSPSNMKLLGADEAYYRTFTAKLLYLAKRVRPDVLLPVSFLTTRATTCTAQDLKKLHRVIKYVRGTPHRGTVVEFGLNPRVKSYIDASYAIHDGDKRSHTGATFLFGKGGPLYVTSVKQGIVTKSSTEAELVAFSDVSSEVISLRNFSIKLPPLLVMHFIFFSDSSLMIYNMREQSNEFLVRK